MRYIRSIQAGAKHVKKKTLGILSVFSVAVLGIASVSAYSPSQTTIYNNIPSPTPSNVASVGFEATSTKEFGGQVDLDGNSRKNPTVTVLMSSWACKSGTWFGKNCITNPGSTFTHPVTLNVYNVNDDDSVGSLITSQTQTFSMPYRPTADDGTNCNGDNAGKWWDGSACVNGKAFKISFDFNNVTLPDDVIIGVAYNTSHNGYAPLGDKPCSTTPQGCVYDSLNVGTNPTPTVGTAEPSADDAYYNTGVASFYCDGGADGANVFRLDAGCWTDYLPAFKVEASPGKGKDNHHSHHHHKKGDKNHHFQFRNFQGWNR